MSKLLKWCDHDYSLAYVYARGYYDGRANCKIADLSWMTDEERNIYGRGFNAGIDDFNKGVFNEKI